MKKFNKGATIRRLRRYFATLIKLRDIICIRCRRNDGSLQTSHIFPKGRHPSMQFLPDNAKILCYQCHIQWWHKSPIEATQWISAYLGGAKYQWLLLKSRESETINETWLKQTEDALHEFEFKLKEHK